MTASDVSPVAVAYAYAARTAGERGVEVTFVQDDVLATHLTGPFDAVFDRGCFHVLVETMHRLLAPSSRC